MIIYYNQIKDSTLEELKERIVQNDKKIIREIKIVDFLEQEQSLIGVYLFFDVQNTPVYVGKTGSRAILERIAAHYDLRSVGFMNSFLSSLSGKRMSRKLPRATEEDLQSAYKISLDYKLLFIELQSKEQINRLENILAREYQPILNSTRGKRKYDLEIKIEDL